MVKKQSPGKKTTTNPAKAANGKVDPPTPEYLKISTDLWNAFENGTKAYNNNIQIKKEVRGEIRKTSLRGNLENILTFPPAKKLKAIEQAKICARAAGIVAAGHMDESPRKKVSMPDYKFAVAVVSVIFPPPIGHEKKPKDMIGRLCS